MRVPYSEGLADHAGPESCVDDPRGWWRSVDRGASRLGIEPRKVVNVRGADAVASAEGETDGSVKRALVRPCVVEDPSMRVGSLGGNREISRLAWRVASRGPRREGRGGRSRG